METCMHSMQAADHWGGAQIGRTPEHARAIPTVSSIHVTSCRRLCIDVYGVFPGVAGGGARITTVPDAFFFVGEGGHENKFLACTIISHAT